MALQAFTARAVRYVGISVDGLSTIETEKSMVSQYFLLQNFGYSESCGGCSVLHLLAHLMNKASYSEIGPLTFLSTAKNSCDTNPGYMTPIMPSWFNMSNSIAIYNEIPQNLFSVPKKIYYILFFPNNGAIYPQGSYILCWSEGFCEGIDSSMKKYTLNLLQIDMRLFDSITRSQHRNKSYILVKKKVWRLSGRVVTIDDTVDSSLGEHFPIETNKLNRLKLLAETKRLVSYDRATFISVEAAAMGCLSIVMPVPNLTRHEWLSAVGDAFRYGVAYGFEEIDYALSTMDQVNNHLRFLASKQEDNVREFLKDVRNFFGTKSVESI
eukprot:jgi/Picsp_1/6177/NSC_03531-R1_AF449195_3WavQ [Vibrio cholerae]